MVLIAMFRNGIFFFVKFINCKIYNEIIFGYRFFDDHGHMANIVAVDFFRGTDIIESALYWNSRKESFVLIN